MYPEPKSSPWGEIKSVTERIPGVFEVETSSRAGFMVHVDAARDLLTPAAQKWGVEDNGYLCYRTAKRLCVLEFELLDKGWLSAERSEQEIAAFREKIIGLIQQNNLEYWNEYQAAKPLKQQLFERLDKNLADYHAYIKGFDKQAIIDMAGRLCVVEDAHIFLKTLYDYKNDDDILYLLQFQNPLEIVADQLQEYRQDLGDIGFVVFDILDKRDAQRNPEYALMSALSSQPVEAGISGNAPKPDSGNQIQAEAQRITEEFLKLTEPNSPNKTHFMVKLSPELIQFASSNDITRLMKAIPIKNLSFSSLKGKSGLFAFALPSKNNKIQLKRSKASVLGDLADKTQEVKARSTPDGKPKKPTERS